MKKLLLSLVTILFAIVGNAQILCSPSFTWSQTPSNLYPYQVTLVNTSTYTGAPPSAYATYNISWGDGSSSSLYNTNTTHNYQNAGSDTVVLTMHVYDSLNSTLLCTSTHMVVITTVVAPCNTIINTTNNGNGSYTFTANNAGGALTYSWNFGDGSSAGNLSPVTHTYTSSGIYTVTLIVSGGGITCTSTTTVNYQTGGTVNCSLLSANFTHSASNLTVYFTNTSTPSNSTNPILINSASWSFGDGTTSTQNYPSHTYASAGTYNVVLTNHWVDSTTGSSIYCTAIDSQIITVSVAPNYIYGSIFWDSTLNISSSAFKVWLITFDTATNIISAIDSTTTSGTFGQVAYIFNNVPAGAYRVKAAVQAGSPGDTLMAPTYHNASTYWGTANIINHNGGSTAYQQIYMQSGTSTNGPGFVAGDVTQGAGKGTGTGVPHLLVLLRNASNQMVKFTYTDANGHYTFSNIGLGTYNIYPENMPQVTTPSSPMTITNANPSFTGVDFVKNSHKIVPKNLDLNDVNNTAFAVHPNPAKDVVTITWSSPVAGNANISLIDMNGKVVLQTTAATNINTNINVSSVPTGVYFLHINIGNTVTQTEQLIIQK
jgi:PKD repeat protein